MESRLSTLEHKLDTLQEEYNLINHKLDAVLTQQQDWMDMLNQGKGAFRLLVMLAVALPGLWTFINWWVKHIKV